jgi:hypothetical protein
MEKYIHTGYQIDGVLTETITRLQVESWLYYTDDEIANKLLNKPEH